MLVRTTRAFRARARRMAVRTALLCACALPAPALAVTQGVIQISDLSRLSIEELADIEVTSVSKHAEAASDAAAALYVITNDDVRRSGATSLPEILRDAPSLQVSRIDALDYSITARGSSGFEAANKLLVLIDGRSVWTPLYSGVDWDQQHVLLDDIDRIEVVTGPGGTLWGANAVNGVVNIMSRAAAETQGLLVVGSGGSLDNDLRLRYGGRIGERLAYRVYATGYQRGDLKTPAGASGNDGFKGGQLGFRADWDGAANAFTVQGDVFDNDIDASITLPGYVRGGNLLARWNHTGAGGGALEVQAYYDAVRREARLIFDSLDTYDVQLQYTPTPLGDHHLVMGAGYRGTDDEFRVLSGIQLLDPLTRKISISNAFLQDSVVMGEVTATAGVKVEKNSYTGTEVLPNLRLAWKMASRQLVWAAVSRAVRNPSRIERDFTIPGVVTPGTFQPEELVAYELGYRGQILPNGILSVSLFHDEYDDLRTNDATPGTVFPLHVGNTMQATIRGAEISFAYDVTPRWRLSGGGTFLDKEVRLKPGSTDVAGLEGAGVDPDYWLKLRSEFRLTERVDLDIRLRYVAETPTLTASGYSGAPAYGEADVRLGWQVREGLELSIAGLNLLDSQHIEASETRRLEIPRSISAGFRWTY